MKTNENSGIESLRRTYAFVLAAAVSEIYSDVKLGGGGLTENGFYYDFKLPAQISLTDLPAIEEKMKELIANTAIKLSTESPEKIKSLFQDQPYKLELLNDGCAIYSLGAFRDLCEYPLSMQSLDTNSFKLSGLSGAYWKGDADGDMLTRISGAAFENEAKLKEFTLLEEDIARRDHRNLGAQLDLFSSTPEIGQGLVLWHPKGAMVRYLLEKFSQQAHIMNGYDWVYTPHIGRAELWKTSGHLGFYKDSMYSPIMIDGEEYYLKPMNCPFHIAIYQSSMKSYR
ncbi:MAG: threonine--tRNA ligase, partial [Bacillota bacterium]|nr:threonine--tRNA ligase [Bacillota bacterium]